MQTLLLLREPILGLERGDVLTGSLAMTRDSDNQREYRFLLDIAAPPAARRVQAFHMR